MGRVGCVDEADFAQVGRGRIKSIDLLTDAIIQFLDRQIEAGAEAIQLFESWAGLLPDVFLYKGQSAPLLTRLQPRKLQARTDHGLSGETSAQAPRRAAAHVTQGQDCSTFSLDPPSERA